MRRTVLLLAVMALAVVAASGAALADNIEGNGGDNRLVGTNGKDTISGGGGDDSIFGRGGADRLFGDSGNDDVHGGKGNDRLQVGLGQDELFGNTGDDFANAIDGQTNDFIDCGEGEGDVAGIDFDFGAVAAAEGDVEGSEVPTEDADGAAPNCESVYVGIGPFPNFGASSAESRDGSGTDLSAIDTRAEAERAEADGLLRQIR